MYFTELFICYNCLRSFIINCNSPIFCVILFGLKNHVIKTKILCLCKILVSVYLQITLTSIKGYSAFNLRWNHELFRVTHISYSKADSEIPSIWNRNILNQKYREWDSLINLYMLICNILRTKKHFSVYKIYHDIRSHNSM